MYFARRTSILAISILSITACGCDAPDYVSSFCGSATATLTSARPVFGDMKQSCLREVNSRSDFGTFKPPVQDDPGCNEIGDQAEGAEAAAKILCDYFSAINALASFGITKAGSDAQSLVAKTAVAVGATSSAQTALGSIAQFFVSAATSGYKQKQLDKDLPEASKNISTVIDALVKIIREDYLKRQLGEEEEKLSTRYKEFAKGATPEVKLMLDGRWNVEEHALLARRDSAENLIIALQAISKGSADLAANAHHLREKDVQSLMGPYVTQLEALVPQIQKGF